MMSQRSSDGVGLIRRGIFLGALVSLLLAMGGQAGLAEAKVKPKVTIENRGGGTVVGDVISPDFACGVPGKVSVYKLKGTKRDLKRDRKLKTTQVTGSDVGPFWRVDHLPVGIRVYAMFHKTKRCDQGFSPVIRVRR